MIKGQVKNKHIQFTSLVAEHRFFELAEGKDIVITIDDNPTTNMRRFFEGAIVPAVFYQNPKSGWESYKDAREAIKLEFCPRYIVRALDGKRAIPTARSTTELSKVAFTKFLDKVTHWMLEQGMDVPDPMDYKEWRDSAPEKGTVYPQLKRLKELYEKANGL